MYTYDTLSRLSKLAITRNDADMVTTDLTYKAGGNSCTTSGQIATWKNSRYNTMSDGSLVGDTTFSYTYDDRGNITAISDGTNSTSYEYDAKGQLTRENNQAAGKTWVYTYDNGGNILSKTEYAYTTATNPSSPTSTKTYTYGDSTWKDLLTGYDGATLTYDAIGNVTNDGTWSYTWQHGRQLAGMSSGTKSLTFDAWGNVLSVTGSMSGTLGTLNPLRYRGYVYDTETKLYYLNSRYYNPATGRFINADTPTVTLLSPGSATWDKNLFAYCDNDPVMRIDAGGQLWTVWATFCTVSGAFIGGVTQVVSNISTGEHWSDGLFGAIAGGAAYGAVIGTTGNEVAASYASAAASSFVDRAVSYIPGLAEFNGNDSVRELTGKNIANSLADTLVDTAVKGTTTAITSKAVGKIIPVDHKNWIKPEKLTSCLFGNFGMKNTGQSVLQGGIMWGTSILKKAAKTLLK